VFLEHYHLREQPFGVTPDPRYLYFSPAHREALASLFYGIETGRGFLSLIAEPGMGKTTLLFQLLQRWKGYVHSAFLFQTQCDSRELIRYLLEDLGLKSDGDDIVRMHSELNDFLYRETLAGKRVILFIDEAQNLSDNVLETVRLLSDFEAPDKKLLQIVLAGQPELAQRLSRPGLAQLRQRIAIRARLDSLPAAEVNRYINHRLQVAGYQGPELFTPGALAFIAERSRGIPRLINNICFNALSLGCATRCEKINSDVVREAAVELSIDSKGSQLQYAQPQTASQVTRGLGPALRQFYFRVKGNLLRGKLFQTSVFSIVLGSMVTYFVGARIGVGKVRPAPGSQQNAESVSPTPDAGRAAGLAVSRAYGEAPPRESAPTRSAGNSRESFTYVVQPKDTLRDLCLSTIGHYDSTALSEIRKLNPDLTNPNHLDVGQKIQLPMNASK
jgi:general secretion pathway protein A